MESPPNYPVAFAGCLPNYNRETGKGRQHVLQMIDVTGGPSYGYVLRYDNEIIVKVGKGEGADVQFNHFGEGGGCSEMPSEVPLVSGTVFVVVVRLFLSASAPPFCF